MSAEITPDRGRVLAVLLAVLLVAGLATDAVAVDHGSWQPACELVYFGAMALVPFLLARLAPTAAAFDAQWLLSSRRHWAWFLGMFVLLFVVKLLVAALSVIIIGPSPPEPPRTLPTPIGIILEAITAVLVVPVAEEIFFRGYLLEQLRKLVRSDIALLAQSLLFGLAHLFARGFYALALFNSFDAILFALVVGLWRIRFRSLLPIVLAHILGNATAIPLYVEAYEYAVSKIDAGTTAQSDDATAIQGLFCRAGALLKEGKHALALRELGKVTELDSRDSQSHYLLGWVYATSPDRRCRDGEKALFHATRLVTLWPPDDPGDKRSYWIVWACLAAAHAARGDFDKAIENQKKAIECLPTVSEEWRPRIEARVKACLNLYRARKPLRTNAISLGGLSDKWVESILHPGPEGFPEIAE